MKIQNIKCYNQKFGNNYYSASYLNNKKRPSEVDIVEETVKQYAQTGEKVNSFQIFYQIGKIFEEYSAYEKAKKFYKKAQNLLDPDTKEYTSIDFDIDRVSDKESQFNDNRNV